MVKRFFPQQIKGVDNDYGIRIVDISHLTKYEIHCFADNIDAVNNKLKTQTGVTIPQQPNSVVTGRKAQSLWLAPQKAMIVSDKKLSLKISSQEALVSDQTHGRVGFRIYGSKAAYVLSKGVSVDCFAPPPVFQTAIHGMALVIVCAKDCFDIYLYRSFAESFETWLLQAALETGYLREL